VNLSGNNLTEIPEQIRLIVQQIDEFDLSRNRIRRVRRAFFETTVTIFSLSMAYNCIESIEMSAFSTLNPLLRLNLSQNNITSVQESTFAKLVNLELLDLSHNSIRFISNLAFRDLIFLITIDLSHNLLTNIDRASFSSDYLKIFYLHENPIRNLFETNSLRELASVKYFYTPSNVSLSLTKCENIKSRLKATRLNFSRAFYFDSVNIVVVPSDYNTYINAPYSSEKCFYILFLLKSNIQMNMHYEWHVEKFIRDCSLWAREIFTKCV
jgi:Leucine-rich repeat (LRR) protein